MKKWQKVTLGIVLIFSLIIVSLICGFIYGFRLGSREIESMSSLSEGYIKMGVLRNIRNGKRHMIPAEIRPTLNT